MLDEIYFSSLKNLFAACNLNRLKSGKLTQARDDSFGK